MTTHRRFWNRGTLAVQAIAVSAVALAWSLDPARVTSELKAAMSATGPYQPLAVPRTEPLVIEPLYDRPDFITDDELAAVLKQVQPRFAITEMKPNHVEHALRTWGQDATFRDPSVRSGAELVRFLTDTSSFLESWGPEIRPLLESKSGGVFVRWGSEKCGSVHHDHCLACLTEAGVPVDHRVFAMGRPNATVADMLQEALWDFRLDERETEWTALGFGLWLAPDGKWIGGDGRRFSFDLLANRLMRGRKDLGVCSGTHRVYSLMVLVRLDDEFPDVLSDPVRGEAWAYLESVRDAIIASQFPDGHWPSNWHEGAEALTHPKDDDLSKRVIATGHHLEWLAIAPQELQPPEDQIRKAFRWSVDTTQSQTPEEILERYTFFSHVGSAAALWRNTHPGTFWKTWEAEHSSDRDAAPSSAE